MYITMESNVGALCLKFSQFFILFQFLYRMTNVRVYLVLQFKGSSMYILSLII